jgi:hypothetical protein
MLVSVSMRPTPLGNTSPNSPLGQASFHSRNSLITIGGNGMLRPADTDLSEPMAL